MKYIKSCPVCNANIFDSFLKVKDHMITKEVFEIVSCETCGFKFTNPVPEDDKIGDYYKSQDYVSHSSSKKGLINFLYNIVRNKTLKNKLSWIKPYLKDNKVLDIGSGTGHFLKFLKDNGIDGLGLEPDGDARAYAIEKNGVNCKDQTALYDLTTSSFDVVSMWHVLEHVGNLNEDLAVISKLVNDNGALFIAVPNCEAHDASVYGEYWAAYDVPRHLYHFREKDLVTLLAKHEMLLKKVIPMKYDAFYISMLSEKYKKGSLLKALWNGWVSNRKAKHNGYSSQVYVFQKK